MNHMIHGDFASTHFFDAYDCPAMCSEVIQGPHDKLKTPKNVGSLLFSNTECWRFKPFLWLRVYKKCTRNSSA